MANSRGMPMGAQPNIQQLMKQAQKLQAQMEVVRKVWNDPVKIGLSEDQITRVGDALTTMSRRFQAAIHSFACCIIRTRFSVTLIGQLSQG